MEGCERRRKCHSREGGALDGVMDKRTTFAVNLAMQTAAPYIAIVVSVVSLIISLGVAVANYKKSKRDSFIQRRDQLSKAISDLNARVSEAHMISARYEMVAVRKAGLPLRGEQADQNTALIASLKLAREGVERGIEDWDENIKRLHFIYSNLTFGTDAAQIERSIALANVATNQLKNANDGYYSSLHILETGNQYLETKLAEADEKVKKINLETDEKIRQINRDYEQGMKNLGY